MKDMHIFGIRPIMEALEAGKTIDKVMVQNGLQGENFSALSSLLRKKNVRIQYVPIEKLNSITSSNHQGVVAMVAAINYYRLDELIMESFEDNNVPFFLILDRITDVRNFGAIVRTAECVGVNAIIIPEKEAAPINADAIKTSAGAMYNMKICKESNLQKTVQFLQMSGIKVFAATEKANKVSFENDMSMPMALIMGSEEDGVSKNLINEADELLKLPIKGITESLNVSVACGAMLYEIVRQRTL